jgi:hypothetical protein
MRYGRLVVLSLGLVLLVFNSEIMQAQRGAYVAPRDIATLSKQADVIVRGHVINARVERHPEFQSLMTVVVTLKSEKVLKGKPGAVYTFRQYIWDVRDRYDAAGYRKGQELLLLMLRVNENGLTSPAGMQQGRFRVERQKDGSARAVNGTGNVHLFRGVGEQAAQSKVKLSSKAARSLTTHKQGAVELGELEEIISGFAGGQ